MSYEGDYLIHFGVKGMRWGVRKDKDRSGSKFKDKSKNDKKKKGLSKKTKIAIGIGAAAAAITIGYFASKKLGLLPSKSINDGKEIVDEILSKSSINAKSIFKNLKASNINPSRNQENCVSCSAAVALNLKGVKAKALSSMPDHNVEKMANSIFKNPKIATMYNPSKEKIESYILKHGEEGANGIVSSQFFLKKSNSNFGHAYNYIIQDGKVNFFDKQNEDLDMNLMMSLVNKLLPTQIIRTDNLELADNFLNSKYVDLIK